ncbi:7-cyano-7-deazaguanine synthase QueC [bacterium]|nr:7-cyano-7-deazaguanine synthase QueC [bacterium]MBU1024873.1 7-cyano-7-deazaguanine synthase QueC [bacterium]
MGKIKEKAVCLVSGGMDSLVSMAMAIEDYDVCMMHAYYGQLTQERELKAFRDISAHYSIDKVMTFSLSTLAQIGGSSLTDPEIDVHTGGLVDGIPNTYVPFRNAHLLSAAVSWAEVLGASRVFIGAVEEDSSGYPDCRESFFRAFEKVVVEGTLPGTKIEIVTPLLHLTKTEIVRKGIQMRVPFELSWSCYKNNEKACGVCDSCILRLRAFEGAGLEDPILYEEKG